ncbi:hypothetical protein I5907_15830 [Panacibacter sp. DH6]|uniref:SMI1/KNR4 family protein n=1 Tax=Panacibacter microcysteis TaxID=2793269 RepID=A0A931GYT7_9BACT|nr:hypothetical protein [Panacibacter microcysteis]MBG9377712.1 hypothetical protein [Panacibacter microcysteis]
MQTQTFKSLLEELDGTLKNYNMQDYEKLQSPLPDKEIDEYLRELKINDENLKALFRWKNGEKENSYCQMMEYGGLQSLKSIKESQSSFKLYDPLLIEIITDNGEESILFNNKPGTHYGKLYMYSVPQLYIEQPISYFDSLEAMVKTIIEGYKEKAFKRKTQKKRLHIDYDKFAAIAKKINKKSAYWKKHNPLKPEEWYEI